MTSAIHYQIDSAEANFRVVWDSAGGGAGRLFGHAARKDVKGNIQRFF
jgi:hypothetical protein